MKQAQGKITSSTGRQYVYDILWVYPPGYYCSTLSSFSQGEEAAQEEAKLNELETSQRAKAKATVAALESKIANLEEQLAAETA